MSASDGRGAALRAAARGDGSGGGDGGARGEAARGGPAQGLRNHGATQVLELHMPFGTVLKVAAAVGVVWACLHLSAFFLLFLLAVLFAVTLNPIVAWLERRGVARVWGVLLLAAAVLATGAFFLGVIFPPLTQQVTGLVADYPRFQQRVLRHVPADYATARQLLAQIFELPASPEVATWLKQPLSWGKVAASALTAATLILVLTFYLLLDGRRLYAWLLAYVPRRHRVKMAETVPEVSAVVLAYVSGQILTSLICGAYTLAVLSILKVPAALPLALLAGLCDVIPVLGVVISGLAAVTIALARSPVTAAIVVAAFLAYHAIENYLIIPWIYGRRLRLSTLAVLIALIVGGTLQGVIGTILVLPIVAAYPIIERIWLHDYLSHEVITDHSALREAAESASDQVVERVLRGEAHGDERGVRPD